MEYRLSNSHVTGIHAEELYNYSIRSSRSNVVKKFLNWCEAQQSDRFLWLAIALFGQIGMTVPLTAFSIVFLGGNNLLLWIILCAVNLPVLISSLAALPTKTTLPFVFFAWFTQTVLIIYCIGFAVLH